jgi:hypothetical protein
MIAMLERNNRKFKIGEFIDGKAAFEACTKFATNKGWTGCKMIFEKTDDELETTMKI